MTERAQRSKEPIWQVRLLLLWRGLRSSWEMFKESKVALTGLFIIIFFGLFGALHPLYMMLSPVDPVTGKKIYDPITGYDSLEKRQPAPPSLRHPLGTDPNGRDVLSQLMYSTSSEFLLGVLAAVITVFIGTIIGAVAAYYGGVIDTFFMRLADVVILFPVISLLIVLSALMHLDLLKLALVLGIIGGFGGITIILKSQALQIKVKPYIEAAKVAGGSSLHIIFRHIIPNLLPFSFLYMMFTVTGAIFSEAVLSFFGLLNIQMSWGIMIETVRSYGAASPGEYWWLFFPAGVSITLLCSAFYLVGRGLDEIVNPRLRKR